MMPVSLIYYTNRDQGVTKIIRVKIWALLHGQILFNPALPEYKPQQKTWFVVGCETGVDC